MTTICGCGHNRLHDLGTYAVAAIADRMGMNVDDRQDLRRMYGDDLDDHGPEEYEAEADPEEWDSHDAPGERLAQPVESAPADGYSPYWNTISFMLRNGASWRCDKCCMELVDHPQFLHVHHLDRDKSNNDTSNLRVLCVLCHAEEPEHGHLLSQLEGQAKELLLERQRLAAGEREAKRKRDMALAKERQDKMRREREAKEEEWKEFDGLYPPRW